MKNWPLGYNHYYESLKWHCHGDFAVYMQVNSMLKAFKLPSTFTCKQNAPLGDTK